jgi:Uma2 family endonuclease
MTYEQSLTVPHPVRLTVEDYLLLANSGAFDRYSKTELINGTILAVNAQHSEHMIVKNNLYRRLADACDRLGRGLQAWSEGAVEMQPDSMPEPDLFVTKLRPTKGAVKRETVVLIGEVAHTTLSFDFGEKAGLYAGNAVPEYWVVDVGAREIHQFWDPAAGRYGQRRSVPFGDRLEAITIAGLSVETDRLD